MPHIRRAYLIGQAAPKFKKTLTKAKVDHKVSGQLDMALLCAMRDALQSDAPAPIILLSPACASFDQFKDFESRGNAFREAAEKMIRLYEAETRKKQDNAA
jgi:UDP-N-acetylmuramoylalanine--D-glutamate ligase